MIRQVSIRVRGRVQGVFFRASTKQKADELHIVGTVRNDSDGSVFIEAQAEEEIIQRFIEWCRQGPPAAIVEEVIVAEQSMSSYSGFKILR